MERKATLIQQKGHPIIKIEFPFNFDDLGLVKTLSGRRFHGDQHPKYWSCPLILESLESLLSWNFQIDKNLQQFLNKSKTQIENVKEIEIPGLKLSLYAFQKKDISFIETKNGRVLIGNEMGLGKTIEALAYLQLHPEKRPAVIVTPASLKLNWEKEAKIWMSPEPSIQILSGTKPYPLNGNEVRNNDLIIINYDILFPWLETLKKIQPQALIFDEIHYIKNNQAKRTKAVKDLGKNIPHIIGLSGTPIINRPIEVYNAVKLIDNTILPDFWSYAHKYCGAKHNGFGWDFSGATNTKELHQKLLSIMIRRKKEDVLTDLPEKIHSYLPMELDNKKEYVKAENNFIQWIRENKGESAAIRASNAEILTKIEELKQLTVKGKMKQAIDWIHNFLEIEEKLVIFATHKSTIEKLMLEFGDLAVKIDGSVPINQREEAIKQFQTDNKTKLFIGNIKAAGVGITLTASSHVAFLELPWTPGELMQAEDRCHRIGQKNNVTIYYILAVNTIEEEIANMLDKKRKVLDSILDGKITEEESLLTSLINKYQERR